MLWLPPQKCLNVYFPRIKMLSVHMAFKAHVYLCSSFNLHLSAFFRYRLAPAHHFPVPYEDVYRVVKHFLQKGVLAKYSVDPERIAVSGDSAGGNLAAAVSQQVLDLFFFLVSALFFWFTHGKRAV